MFGLAELETLESLRLTAAEDLDTNAWDVGADMIWWDWGGVSRHSRFYRARSNPDLDRHRT